MIERRSWRPASASLAALLLTWAGPACTGDAPKASQDRIDGLLTEWRAARAVGLPGQAPDVWTSHGRGRLMGSPVAVTLSGDSAGRYRLEIEGPIPYAEVHDGAHVWKLAPWGVTMDLGGYERELSLLTNWVISGHWLDPGAPLDIRPATEPSSHEVIGLEVGLVTGGHRFALEVDRRTGHARRLTPRSGGESFEILLSAERQPAGSVIPATVRMLDSGREQAVLELGPPLPHLSDDATWTRPRQPSQASFEAEATPYLEQVRRTANGFLYVRPEVNGIEPGWFLVDTGSPVTILDTRTRERLALGTLGESKATGVGGTVDTPVVRIDSLRLGPLRVGPAWVIATDLETLAPALGFRPDGIIGCDVLGRAVLEYDIEGRKIGLHDPSRYELLRGAWQPLRRFEGKPVVTLLFEDRQADFNLDSAAAGSMTFSSDASDRLGLLGDRDTRASATRGLGGSIAARRGVVHWLEFGGRRIEEVPAVYGVARSGAMAYPYPDGLAGTSLLDDFILIIDLPGSRIAYLDR